MVLFIAHVATKILNTTVAVTENLTSVYAPFVGGALDVGNGGQRCAVRQFLWSC
jgi:hypothetical protein